jgi:hypothetical protein
VSPESPGSGLRFGRTFSKPGYPSRRDDRTWLALDRLYRAAERQIGRDCLDRILADCDFDALESVLVGFLAQLRNEVVINGIQRSSAWASALEFVTDRMDELNDRLLRLSRMYDQLRPNPPKAGPPIRALPPAVVEDLYSIFDPSSLRNPFRSEGLRWRNALTFLFLLLLRLAGALFVGGLFCRPLTRMLSRTTRGRW